MTQPLSLLVATDLSALSRHAALRVAMLAGEVGGTLALLHVLETPALVALRRLLGQAEADLEQRLATQASDTLTELAQIILLHACALPFEGKMRFAGVSDATVMQYRSDARRKATTQLQLLADQAGLPSHQWTSLVTQGDPGQGILQQQVERDADLIVLGKHRAGMTEELLLGSVTQQVLGQAHCDVLVTAC